MTTSRVLTYEEFVKLFRAGYKEVTGTDADTRTGRNLQDLYQTYLERDTDATGNR